MLKERMKNLRKHLKIKSQIEFSNIINWPIGRVQDLESGKVKEMRASEAEEIQEKFLINGWWLLTGKGEMILSESQNMPVAQNEPKHNNDEVAVNYYPDMFAAAGYGAINGDTQPEVITVSRSFLSNMFGLSSFVGIDIIHVIGDSMEPFVPNGETILLQRTNEARNNQIVIARINDELFVKRILRDPLGRWVKLISDNNLYPDIYLDQEQMKQLEIIGVVYGRFRPF